MIKNNHNETTIKIRYVFYDPMWYIFNVNSFDFFISSQGIKHYFSIVTKFKQIALVVPRSL